MMCTAQNSEQRSQHVGYKAEDYYPHFTGEEDGKRAGHLMCLGDRRDLNLALPGQDFSSSPPSLTPLCNSPSSVAAGQVVFSRRCPVAACLSPPGRGVRGLARPGTGRCSSWGPSEGLWKGTGKSSFGTFCSRELPDREGGAATRGRMEPTAGCTARGQKWTAAGSRVGHPWGDRLTKQPGEKELPRGASATAPPPAPRAPGK